MSVNHVTLCLCLFHVWSHFIVTPILLDLHFLLIDACIVKKKKIPKFSGSIRSRMFWIYLNMKWVFLYEYNSDDYNDLCFEELPSYENINILRVFILIMLILIPINRWKGLVKRYLLKCTLKKMNLPRFAFAIKLMLSNISILSYMCHCNVFVKDDTFF